MAGLACSWKDDIQLKQDLTKYVAQNLPRLDILNYMFRDFREYTWSMRTLDRRLRYFEIYYSNHNVSVEHVTKVVKEELEGPGQLLGYRAMHLKIRQKHGLNVPRTLVHNVMYDLDPDGLENRRPGKKEKKVKENFVSKGTNWVWSLDGHDKLMGYQNSTFPIAIYGCIDTASRKILWLRVWDTNSKPELIAKWFLEHLYVHRIVPAFIRIDKGSETGVMATMQAYLRRNHNDLEDPTESVIYGPSTSNKIERWWRELHDRLEKYFKSGLTWLLEENYFDPQNERDRNIMKYVMIPLIQHELDEFKDSVWNIHRVRQQKNILMPVGIPNHIYDFPKEYNLNNCGFPVSEEDLKDVAEFSSVLKFEEGFLDDNFFNNCNKIIGDPEEMSANKYVEAYLTLRNNLP